MKTLLLYLSLFFSVAVSAQMTNQFQFGLGTGVGRQPGDNISHTLQVQASYNVQNLHLVYAQNMYLGLREPSFMQLRLGYQAGRVFTIMPYAGYSHRRKSFEKNVSNDRSVIGAELGVLFRKPGILSSKVYIDVNRSNEHLLFNIGIKGSLKEKLD